MRRTRCDRKGADSSPKWKKPRKWRDGKAQKKRVRQRVAQQALHAKSLRRWCRRDTRAGRTPIRTALQSPPSCAPICAPPAGRLWVSMTHQAARAERPPWFLTERTPHRGGSGWTSPGSSRADAEEGEQAWARASEQAQELAAQELAALERATQTERELALDLALDLQPQPLQPQEVERAVQRGGVQHPIVTALRRPNACTSAAALIAAVAPAVMVFP